MDSVLYTLVQFCLFLWVSISDAERELQIFEVRTLTYLQHLTIIHLIRLLLDDCITFPTLHRFHRNPPLSVV